VSSFSLSGIAGGNKERRSVKQGEKWPYPSKNKKRWVDRRRASKKGDRLERNLPMPRGAENERYLLSTKKKERRER